MLDAPADHHLADGLTVMTYNAEFLWDGIEPEDGSSRIEFPWRGNPQAAKQHMQNVAGVIRQADADVVLLQEVEDEAAVERLNAILEGQGYTAQFVPGTFTGHDNGGGTHRPASIPGSSGLQAVGRRL